MLPSWLRQLFRQKFLGHGAIVPLHHGLSVESLEDRALMATTWTGQASVILPTPDYRWSNSLNWSDGVPDPGEDVLFPAIANGLAKPNAVLNANGSVTFPANSIIDRDYEIGTLQIQGDNYHIDAGNTPATLTLNGGVTVNFAGTVGVISGLSLLGPLTLQTASNLRINLNGSVSIPGVGIVNQFANLNTGELYITATLADAPNKTVGLLKTGTGSITLAGANVYTGVTSVQAGTLVAANDGAFGSSVNETRVSSGATVGVSGGVNGISDSLQLIGSGVNNRGALRGLDDSLFTFRNFVPGGGGTWIGGIALVGSASIGADRAATDLAIDIRGVSGTGTLTKVGFGDLSLLVDSTYAGDTLVTEGSVSIFTDNALSAGFKTTVSNEATLNVDSGLAINETLELTGNGFSRYDDAFNRPAGALSLFTQGGTATWLGTITLLPSLTGGTSARGASIGAVPNSTLVLAGELLGAAANNTFTKVDQGNVRIARANTNFLGRTSVDNGTLEIADARAVGAGAITVNSNLANSAIGTLQVEGTFALTQALALNGVGYANAGAVHVVAPLGSGPLGSSSLTLSGSVVLNSSTALNVDPLSTLTVTGVVSDVPLSPPAELNKLGDGTLVLAANNTYTGQTVLRAGVTSIRADRALGTAASGTSITSGAVLSLDAPGGLTITDEAITISGSNSAATRSTLRASAGTNVFVATAATAGTINFTDNAGAPVNVEVAAGASLELRTRLGGSAPVHKVGAGTLSFTGTGANTNTGTIFVDAGTLALGKGGGNATNGAVTVGDGAGAGTDRLLLLADNQLADNQPVVVNSTGQFDLNGRSDAIGGTTALTVAGGTVQTGAGVLTLNGDISTSGAAAAAGVSGNVFLTATRTFLFRPTPALSLASSLNSSQFTNNVTFTVLAPRTGTEPVPSGSISFYDGDTLIGSVQSLQPDPSDPTNRSIASVTTNTLSGGLHTIRAVYSGSNFYAPTTLVMAEQQAVRNVPVLATLQSSDITAEPGQSVTFKYHVAAPAGSVAPTGSVAFYDNGVQIGAAQTLTVDGFAYVTTSFPTPVLAADRFRTITATYSGDLFFSSSTVTLAADADPNSPYTRPVSQQVGFQPLVQLTADNNSVTGTRDVTLTFTASGGITQPTPAGTVEFFLDGVSLNSLLNLGGPITLDATGKAILTVPEVMVVGATSASWAGGTATITTNAPHNLAVGDTVTVTGTRTLGGPGYNGTFTVTAVAGNTFSYTLASNPGVYVGGGTVTTAPLTGGTWDGTTGIATVTTRVPHGLSVGDTVTIVGASSTSGGRGFNGTFRVNAVTGPFTFSYTLLTDPGTYLSGGDVTTATTRLGEHEVTAQYVSSDAIFTDALATLGVSETSFDPTNNLEADTPVVSQFFSNKSSIRATSIGNDSPFYGDATSFTFRINTNDTGNFGANGDAQHPTPTGTVTFRYTDINGISRNLGTVELGRSFAVGGLTTTPGQAGEATITNVTFPRNLVPVPGNVTITATYSGDDYYDPVMRTTVQGIVAGNATVRLSSSNSEAIVGEGVTYRLEVDSTAVAGTPPMTTITLGTGTATFIVRDAQGQIVDSGGATVVAGVATFTTSYSKPGAYTVTVQYGGDSNFGATTVTLAPGQTVVAPLDAELVSSANSVPAGFNVTFTFRSTVGIYVDTTTIPNPPNPPIVFANRGTAPAATGTVTFFDGPNQIGATQIIGPDGTASITINNLVVGRRNIRAVYSGDGTYATQTVTLGEVQVVGTPPLLEVTTSNNVIEEGDAVTIRVEATGDLGLPTGRVTIRDAENGFAAIASGVLLRNGVATFSTSALAAGRHRFVVEYTGDGAYAPIQTTMTQDLVVINPVRFQVRTSANADVSGSVVTYPVAAGQSVTYTAELVTGTGANASGIVTFFVFDQNGAPVGAPVPVPLVVTSTTVGTTTTFTAGASATLVAPAAGTYRVVAVYSGDENYEPLAAEFAQPVVATVGNLPAAAPNPTTVARFQPTVTASAAIGGAAGAGIVSSGTGSLTLSGNNTYTGSTLITGAGNVVTLGANNVLPDGTAVTITGGTLNVNGQTDTVGSVQGTGTLNLLAGSVFSTGALNTNTDFTGIITGAGTLRKVGTGALTLGATNNAFIGAVNVAAGTLFLAANYPGASGAVQAGATLGGTGTLGAVTVNAGGILAPGGTAANPNTVGTLTGTGNLTLNPGASFVVNVNGTTPGAAMNGYDVYLATSGGSVNLNGATLAFNLGYTPAINDSFTLVSVSGGGTLTGTFAGLPDLGTFVLNNRVFQIDYTATGAVVTMIAFAATPAVTSSDNPALPNTPITFTFTLTPTLGTDARPTGTVQFLDNGTPIGAPVTLTGGATGTATATLLVDGTLIPFLTNGAHTITAQYLGDGNYQAVSPTLTQLVTMPSTTTLTPQQGPIVFGANASFIAAVTQVGAQVPTGSFTFTNAATGAVLGAAALDGTGRAVFNTSTLPPGTLTIIATYSGDNFYRSSAGTATQVVDRQARTVVGSDAGPITTVQVYDSRTGGLLQTLSPFDLYRGGVKVATGDVNGDGVADIVVSAGAGADGGHVKVYDGVTFNQIASFFTFLGYNGGVNVAVGDVDGDGFGDVVVGTAIANDHVKAFSGRQLIATGDPNASTILSFFAYSTSGGNTVGVTVGTGDVDGDGRADIITGSATFAGHVKAFSGANAGLLGSYFAYGAGYLGGIYVAGGDLDGDGKAEIITGATNAPHVKALRASDGGERASFFAFLNGDGTVPTFGARVGAVDRTGDRLADILVGSGGGAPAVKVFSGLDPSQLIESFIADPAGQPPSASGVFVGGSGLK